MTRRYLERSASTTFLLFLLGIPVFIWMYSVFTELNKRLPTNKRLNPLLILVPIGYQTVYILLVLTRMVDPFHSKELHYIGMFCGLLCIALTSVMIYRFEEYREPEPSSGLLIFIQIWFYPIGIWYLQPHLNDYIEYPIDDR